MKAADYQINSIKREPSGSGHFAIRTNFDDEREWRIVSLSVSEEPRYATHDDVADWQDL